MDLVEHVSHFNQRMAIHLKNETLMCKVFPSSLDSLLFMAMCKWETLKKYSEKY